MKDEKGTTDNTDNTDRKKKDRRESIPGGLPCWAFLPFSLLHPCPSV
jgi:hypothetical protein